MNMSRSFRANKRKCKVNIHRSACTTPVLYFETEVVLAITLSIVIYHQKLSVKENEVSVSTRRWCKVGVCAVLWMSAFCMKLPMTMCVSCLVSPTDRATMFIDAMARMRAPVTLLLHLLVPVIALASSDVPSLSLKECQGAAVFLPSSDFKDGM